MLLKSAKSFCQAASKPLTLCEITSSSKIAQTGFSKRKVRGPLPHTKTSLREAFETQRPARGSASRHPGPPWPSPSPLLRSPFP